MSDCPDCENGGLAPLGSTKTTRKIDELLVNQTPFTESDLFAAKGPIVLARDGTEVLPKLEISPEALNTLYGSKSDNVTMSIPGPNGEILKLLLVKQDLYAPGFKVTEADTEVEFALAVTYFGVVEGKEGSRVIINIFQDQVTGVLTIDDKPIEIVKDTTSSDSNEYVMYRTTRKPLSCHTDASLKKTIEGDSISSRAVLSKYIRLFLDSMNGNTTDVNSLFTQVADIYLNDPDVEINIQLAGINIWTNPGTLPFTYNGVNSFTDYSNYRATNQIANADAYEFIPVDNPNVGNGVAWVDVLCRIGQNSPDEWFGPFGVSIVQSGTTPDPDVSFSQNAAVLAHELGHTIGSPHTFDCAWAGATGLGGGGTAYLGSESLGGCGVDPGCVDCASANPQGTCTQPSSDGYLYSSNGATGLSGYTVMAYCQTLVPMRFGPQPGALLRQKTLAANCLLCVHPDTLILMVDGTFKKIKDIKRGDWVMGDKEGKTKYQVAKIAISRYNPNKEMELVVFEKGCLGINTPSEKLIVTGAHPVFHKGIKYSARKFKNISGVTYYEKIQGKELLDITEKGSVEVYDLQFEDEGSYIAGGVQVESRSPWSAFTPLEKDLYFNTEFYTEERTYDSLKKKFIRSWDEVKEEKKWTLSNVKNRVKEIV